MTARTHKADPRGKVKKSLVYSFWDGLFCSCMIGFTSDYISPYALALKATNRQIAFLGAIPPLVSALVQLKTADLVERWRSRRRVVNLSVLAHLLMGIPIILIPLLFSRRPVIFLIIFVTFFSAFNAFAGPAWASLMSAYIPHTRRGAYFGWRNRVFGGVTIVCLLLAGFILHLFHKNPLTGFMIIFSAAFVCRFVSWCFLTRMYEPPFKEGHDAYFSFGDFLRRVRESNFAKFVLLVSALHFCVNIAAPFFSVLMLRDLKLNYPTYTVIVTAVTFVNIFTMARWGRHADKAGNLKVLKITAAIIASLPLWWILNQHPLYLVAVQALSGFAWSGFNLCALNFIYDAARPDKRTRCIAYFNVCTGTGVCAGALLGGALVNHMPNIFGYSLMTLFVISSSLRFVVVALFWKLVREVRPVRHIGAGNLILSMLGVRPVAGLSQSEGPVIVREQG